MRTEEIEALCVVLVGSIEVADEEEIADHF